MQGFFNESMVVNPKFSLSKPQFLIVLLFDFDPTSYTASNT